MMIRKQATLQRFDGKQAILLLEGGQEVPIPKEELGKNLEEGMVFTIQILPESEALLEKEELARTLLNQILHGQEHDRKNSPSH